MVTQKQIAQRLGLARSTVSAALNDVYREGGDRIPQEKRDNIKKVAREMGYKVDDMARALATGKSKVVAFVTNGAPDELIHGLNLAAEKDSFLVKSFILSEMEEESPDRRMHRIADIIQQQRIPGVIIHYGGASVYTLIARLENANIPCVITNTLDRPYSKVSCFWSDDRIGGAMVADYFLQLGYRNFACVGTGGDNITGQLRMAGFIEQLNSHGSKLAPSNISRGGDIQKIYKMVCGLKKLPAAIFCVSGKWAVCTLTACLSAGLEVPEDIAIAGYGNYSLTANVIPSITVIEENHFERGFEGCKHLLDMIENNASPQNKTFAVRLLERDSCRRADTNKPKGD